MHPVARVSISAQFVEHFFHYMFLCLTYVKLYFMARRLFKLTVLTQRIRETYTVTAFEFLYYKAPEDGHQ
jgi:hypothetical protein